MKYIYNRITLLLFLILLTFTPSSGASTVYTKHYHKWMEFSSDELLKRGDRFLRVENQIDSALVCFSIVNNMYNKNMSDEEKLNCCKAGFGKWYIYFAKIYDYTKAYESLLNAKEILTESKLDYPDINLAFAVFYHTLAGYSYDTALEKESFEYCMDGFWQAYKQKDQRLLDIFFCNIMLVSETLDKIQSLDKEWNAYKEFKHKESFNYRFNILQYKARLLKSQKKYDEALKHADELIAISQKNAIDPRRTNIACSLKAVILYAGKDYTAAIRLLKDMEKMLVKENLTDCRLGVYDFLTKCYDKLNDNTNSNKFGNRFFLLKDSIINLKQMTNVSKIAFINEIKEMDNEIKEIKYKRKSEMLLLTLSTVFSLTLLCFIALLFHKNKQLKSKNRKLYERNIEMMNSEDQEIKNITVQRTSATNGIAMNEEFTNTSKDEEQIKEDYDSDTDGEKYKNSSLSAEDKKELLAKILCVMENIDEICSVSFSAERLAQLCNSKYKYVSQVINEKYGCNFNMFLNKFRIKEACRRFSDVDKYGQYTIDAMSQGLGFKSRTTFTSSFKKIIGLTPSQYSKLAKEDKNKSL